MSIGQFFNKTIIVRRLKSVGTDKRNLEATATVEAGIQNVEIEPGSNVADITGRTFKIYTDVNDDIKVNDQITDSDTEVKYLVKAVDKKDYAALEHLEIVAERLDN